MRHARTSLFAQGTTVDFQYWIWGVWGQCVSSAPGMLTYNTFFKILVWSLKALRAGKWPTHDWNGRRYLRGSEEYRLATTNGGWLADGYYGELWVLQGDLDFYLKVFGLENYNSAVAPCIFCPCNLTTLNWRDFRLTAAFVDHIYTKASWLASHPDHIVLFDHVSILAVAADWMHNKHLGTDQYFYGSVLWLLVYNILDQSRTAETNFDQVWATIKRMYRSLRTSSRFVTMNLKSFTNPSDPTASYPKLKGNAAMVKHLGAPLLKVFEELMDRTDRHQRMLRLALEKSVQLEQILDNNTGNKLPATEAQQFMQVTSDFLLLLNSIALHYNQTLGLNLFDITIKCHQLLHCALQAQYIHPRLTWNYAGEDYMKHCRRLILACSRGTGMYDMSHKFIERYLFALHWAFVGFDDWHLRR